MYKFTIQKRKAHIHLTYPNTGSEYRSEQFPDANMKSLGTKNGERNWFNLRIIRTLKD